MASTMDECVLDFDIELLHQSTKFELEKALHTIRVLKTKITRTSDVLKKYYSKVAECKQLEDLALAAKEDYQQACMENIKFREQAAGLEEEIKRGNESQKILRESYNTVLNQYEGIQSHSKQLEQLVKENETTIESLKLESQLEKSTYKDSEKKSTALQKEVDYLRGNISRVREVVLGKKKVTKEIKLFLNKYGTTESTDAGHETQGENSSDEDAFEDCLSPLGAEVDNVLGSPAEKKDETTLKLQSTNIIEENTNTEDESESSTGVVSSDTGRGSSLACSLAGSILSPEYFIHHSPVSGEMVASKNKMVISMATSPILRPEFINVATSPIMFKDELFKKMEREDIEQSNTDVQVKSKSTNKVMMIDRVVSPIFVTQYIDMSTSTGNNIPGESTTSPYKRTRRTTDRNSISDQNPPEKMNTDINSINDFDDESSDGEIQMIFDKMRFNQNLITPLPTTPAKPRTEVAASIATQTVLHTAGVCPDAVKLKEDNAALKDTVDKLAQQVTNMNDTFVKCFLSILNANTTNADAHKMLLNKCSIEENGISLFQNPEPKACIIQDKEETIDNFEIIKRQPGFKSRISKMKELFDDSSPPSPSEFIVPKPPVTLSRSPLPSPPVSPAPEEVDINTSKDSTIENISFKTKEKLHFEDPPSNEGSLWVEELSDQEIYEHEIVVELAPDSNESDRSSLHAILMEQQLIRQSTDEEKPVKKTPKKKLTKLERLRKNMVPKSKISKEISPERKTKRKLRIQPKRLMANKERILGDSVRANNDKAAYEKACKVMAELKTKEKVVKKKYVSVATPENNNLMSQAEKVSPPVVENGMEINLPSKSFIQDNFVVQQQSPVSPNKLPEKDCSANTRKSFNYTKPQNKDSSSTPSKSLGDLKCIPVENDARSTGHRTRSQNKSESEQESISQLNPLDTNHLKSPALKKYGRNVISTTSETNNNNKQIRSYVHHENLVIIANKIPNTEADQHENRKRLKRPACDKPDIVPKRILRRSISHQETKDECLKLDNLPEKKTQNEIQTEVTKDIVSYDDLDLFSDNGADKPTKPDQAIQNTSIVAAKESDTPKLGILCAFIDKYACKRMKQTPKTPDNIINAISNQLEDGVAYIQKLSPMETKPAMDNLVKDLKTKSANHFICGLINFLKEPARKIESYNKINVPPAPPMTKVEQILIYVVAQLRGHWPNLNVVESILSYIEYTLFMLNRTPEFDVIETLSHFYAVLCRYNKDRNRLRLFIIDAMYCLQYKAVPLIKQCMDVWMHILPLAHLGLAKNPLVQCLVYLLHFYKCEDKFNRVQEIRNVLHRKYFYEVSEWNEPGILEMIRNCILELRDISGEKKMLRMSLIILAKRNGAQWCHKHIIKNMLLPILEQTSLPERVKLFCVALLGPLLKPFPMEMKVNCEIVMNQLFNILERNPSAQMEEAIFTSLIYMSRHNLQRVIKALLCWTPERVSSEFEELLKNFVRERPVKSWRQVVSKIFN